MIKTKPKFAVRSLLSGTCQHDSQCHRQQRDPVGATRKPDTITHFPLRRERGELEYTTIFHVPVQAAAHSLHFSHAPERTVQINILGDSWGTLNIRKLTK